MAIDIRSVGGDEVEEFSRAISHGFGDDLAPRDRDERIERLDAMMGLDRTIAAFDGDSIVGTGGTFGFDMTIPGGSIPMAGLTMITVRPTHTRRGILRQMLGAHLDDAREREEPVSGLWASESSIYGRFGFGVACDYLEVEFEAGKLGFADPRTDVIVHLIDADAAAKVLPPLYDAIVPYRPGMLGRSEAWWKWRTLEDLEQWRRGKTAHRHAVAYRGDEPVGYAIYRQKAEWENFLPGGTVSVEELMAVEPAVRLELWRYLASIDLFPNIKAWNRPVDFDLPLQVADPRRIKRKLNDALYLRINDVETAFSARAYRSSASLSIRVHTDDEAITYRLDVSPEGAECSKTSAEPDLEMDGRTLGSVYLGGASPAGLARAGRISGDHSAIRRLDTMMSWDVAPWCPEVF